MSTSRTHHGIVVGVDGSPPSKVAVDWAAREALLRNLPLTIIHVIPSPMVSMCARGAYAPRTDSTAGDARPGGAARCAQDRRAGNRGI